jgi:hypothetical protein
VRTLSSAKEVHPSTPEVLSKNAFLGKMGLAATSESLVWPALKRKLDRVSPSYKE